MLHFLSKMPFYAAYRWVNSGQVGEIVSLKTHGNLTISHTYLKLNTSENGAKTDYLGLRFIMLSTQDARDKVNRSEQIENMLKVMRNYLVFRLGIPFLERTFKTLNEPQENLLNQNTQMIIKSLIAAIKATLD